jgi:hypothetical protein
MTLNNVLNKNAQKSGLLVKMIQNVSQLYKIAKKNAEQRHLAGLFVFQVKEAKPQSMLLNVLKPINAFDLYD